MNKHLAKAFEGDDAGNPLLSDAMYNRLKWMTLVLLPAISAAYFTLSGVLSLPYSEQVVGTIAVICIFLGTVLGLSSKQYNNSEARFDGQIVLTQGDDEDSTDLRFQMDPAALVDKDFVLVKVDKTNLP